MEGRRFRTSATTGPQYPFYDGMTLRDWLAGQALAGMLAKPTAETKISTVAREAYAVADAVLAARDAS